MTTETKSYFLHSAAELNRIEREKRELHYAQQKQAEMDAVTPEQRAVAESRIERYSAENIGEQKNRVRSYIDLATEVFGTANKELPHDEGAPFEVATIQTDDMRSMETGYRRDADVLEAMQAVREGRYADRPNQKLTPVKRVWHIEQDGEIITLDEEGRGVSVEKIQESMSIADRAHASLRNKLASSWRGAATGWDKIELTEDEYGAQYLKDLSEEDIQAGYQRAWHKQDPEFRREREKQYFHDVLMVDLNGRIPEEKIYPGGILAIPTFANEEKGHQLIEAASRVIERLSKISEDPDVQAKLDQLSLDEIEMVRKSSKEEGAESRVNTPTRMLTEAVATITQLTAVMLASLDKDYDLATAMKSLNGNGVYMMMGLLPAGIVGPASINGTRWDTQRVLDAEKLDDNDYALSEGVRMNIIGLHNKARDIAMAKLATRQVSEDTWFSEHRSPRAHMPFGMGCPARSKDMKVVIDMIVDEIEKDQVVDANKPAA